MEVVEHGSKRDDSKRESRRFDDGNIDVFQRGQQQLAKKDLFDLEANQWVGFSSHHRQDADWGTIMRLAFQCIGVAFGDLGTSPLYTFSGIFPDGIKHNEDILGALSLIFYSIISISLIKYIFIVLAANDNGEGGTFALYSLICRHAKVSMLPNHQIEDREQPNHNLEVQNGRTKLASALRSKLEKSSLLQYLLLFMSISGVAMLIGDGIFTPCMSVLSAVGGIQMAKSSLTNNTVKWISAGILIVLFQIQRFGTNKVGYAFAPILLVWFAFIACIGIYNIAHYDAGVMKAVNPWYIVQYFQRNKKQAWISLGGVILCLTGSEALFADLGHFHIRSLQISTCSVLIPSVLCAYFGQGAYLRIHSENVSTSFYSAIPGPLYWPQFVVAVLAAIIASQSLISATFSIVHQAVSLGCFPRVKVVHTSPKYGGQVYVPEINTLLMLICVAVTLGFRDTVKMGNAYGLAVACVFVITSMFLVLVMVLIWKTNPILIILYVLTIGLIELLFLSSVFSKFVAGGFVPFIIAFVLVVIMLIWNYGHRTKHLHEQENNVPIEKLTDIASDQRIQRIPGLGLFYTHLVRGIPPIFTHYVSSVPALHSVLVFMSIKSLPINRVVPEDRFFFQQVSPHRLIFRCIVRYGYNDKSMDQRSLEETLINQLRMFIQEGDSEDVQRKLALLDGALKDGDVVYLLGESEMVASKGSGLMKKLTLDYCYHWLNRVVRQPQEVFFIPRKHLLKVGMTYEV